MMSQMYDDRARWLRSIFMELAISDPVNKSPFLSKSNNDRGILTVD